MALPLRSGHLVLGPWKTRGVVVAPKTSFVRRAGADLAYQVFGNGPPNVLDVRAMGTHREQVWEFPFAIRWQEWLARVARVAQYDPRGSGMSDALPVGGYPIEELAADALAVMDAAEFSQAVLWGDGSGGAVAIWLAVNCPDRVTGLVLDDATACRRSHPGYEVGLTDAEVAERRTLMQATWGTGATIGQIAAHLANDERIRDEWARYERIAATPSQFVAVFDVNMALDVRHLLPAVAVPTLVIHSATNTMIPASHGRYLAEHIAGARYLEVAEDAIVEWEAAGFGPEVSEFLTGSRTAPHLERLLRVVLFTDMAGSTERMAALGDAKWREVLDNFRRHVRKTLARYEAHEVNTRGDDFFVVVESPSIAVAIAREVRSEAAGLGLQVRSGIHLGEVEHQGDDYTGLTVHIGARIAALAAPDEILISQTVRDALAGSVGAPISRGTHRLKGVPDEWRVFAIDH